MNAAEICVLGAGPAGTALAARLARLGHDVVVVERHRFPRPRVGESLGPGIWPLLDALGVRERVAAAGFVRSARARIRWQPGPAADRVVPDGLTVDRGAFDTILLDNARDAGATVLQPTRAGRPRRVAEGWAVPVDGRVLRARFVADATGRHRVLGGSRTPVAPPTLALHTMWRGGLPQDRPQTRIDVLADGWLWGAHLPDGGFRAMAFLDPRTLTGRDRERLYHRLLGASPMFAEILAGATPTGPVRTCDATSYVAADPVDASTVKVGEAAFTIDPLSSSGVQAAIQTGLAAGAVAHTVLTPGGDTQAALRYYADLVAHTVARHAATATALYAEHETHADTTFWRCRSTGTPPVPAPGPPPTPLAELLPQPVRLAADAALEAVPCLVANGVELRRALTHPTLNRPVAFLGGTELAPFLDILAAAPSLACALDIWDRSPSGGHGPHIATWLARHGLVEALPHNP